MSTLRSQKKIASRILKCGLNRVWINPVKIKHVQDAISAADIRRLIGNGDIKKLQAKGISRSRARKIMIQKKRGRRRSIGSRKGTLNVRNPRRRAWIALVRALRNEASGLREKGSISSREYRDIYPKIGAGFFRSRKHLNIYIERRRQLVKSSDVKSGDKNERP